MRPAALMDIFDSARLPVTDLRPDLPTHPTVPWGQRKFPDLKLLVIHHTAGSVLATAAGIAQYHINKGWAGIAYTFYIHTDGKIDFCHRVREWGPHAAPTNAYSLGIALAGTYTKVRPPEIMVESLCGVINCLVLFYLEHNWQQPEVQPHFNFARTQCPGLVWPAYLEHPACLEPRV